MQSAGNLGELFDEDESEGLEDGTMSPINGGGTPSHVMENGSYEASETSAQSVEIATELIKAFFVSMQSATCTTFSG